MKSLTYINTKSAGSDEVQILNFDLSPEIKDHHDHHGEWNLLQESYELSHGRYTEESLTLPCHVISRGGVCVCIVLCINKSKVAMLSIEKIFNV